MDEEPTYLNENLKKIRGMAIVRQAVKTANLNEKGGSFQVFGSGIHGGFFWFSGSAIVVFGDNHSGLYDIMS